MLRKEENAEAAQDDEENEEEDVPSEEENERGDANLPGVDQTKEYLEHFYQQDPLEGRGFPEIGHVRTARSCVLRDTQCTPCPSQATCPREFVFFMFVPSRAFRELFWLFCVQKNISPDDTRDLRS